jgi:transposase InsO family protein
MSYALGVDVNTDVVRRILQQHCAPGPNSNGPSWLTALAHAKDSLWSLDLFRCESITLRSCWVLAIIDVFSRRFVSLAVEHGAVDGPVVCRMFNRARAKQSLPKYLSTDPDPLFRFHRWLANLRVLDVEEIKSLPYTPVSHPFVKRGPRHQRTLSLNEFRERSHCNGLFRATQRGVILHLAYYT